MCQDKKKQSWKPEQLSKLKDNGKSKYSKEQPATFSYSKSGNTQLFLHQPLTLSPNSFQSFQSSKPDSQTINNFYFFKLDYLRISSNNLGLRQFEILRQILFSETGSNLVNKPWHPDPNMPKSKKYQARIISSQGSILGFTKKALNRGKNTRYLYDIMLDLTGAYFNKPSLLEQIELVDYLNSNLTIKCHRLDVAIDDYSGGLFPVLQMREAGLQGNKFGFTAIDDSYLKVINGSFQGTLGLGSRTSQSFVRIYTKGNYLVRWETELKRAKAQELFNQLADLELDKLHDISEAKGVFDILLKAAIGTIDFRDKTNSKLSKNLTKNRTVRLPFWQSFLDLIHASIDY